MNFPITGPSSLVLAVIFGAFFGILLHRGRVADYNVIVNMFRLRDFTVLRVMLTAIIVGGIGVYILHQFGLAQYHIKTMYVAGVVIGAILFGIGMVVYGYCPGTAVAAIGTGSLHALAGALGMLAGGVIYAFSFSWVQKNILKPFDYGKMRLPDITGIPDLAWFVLLGIIALLLFRFIDSREQRSG